MDARRDDLNKNKLNLIPPVLIEEIGKVMTFGSLKYGDHNWKKGMQWSRCIGSLKRHLLSFEKGIDFDEESKLYHLSHLIVNAMFILEYYSTHPEFDDRPSVIGHKKYAIDIDGVLADFNGHFFKYLNLPYKQVKNWSDRTILDNFDKIIEDESFWSTRPIYLGPSEWLLYEPAAYITARTIPHEWTDNWLKDNDFPKAPLLCGKDKVTLCKAVGAEVFIDDSYDNYLSFKGSGIKCFLFTADHNIKHNVGPDRINSLDEFFTKIEIIR